MAPPNMFSRIRNNHRRSGSTPTSPQDPQWNDPSYRSPAQAHSPSFPPVTAIPNPRVEHPVSSLPPILPPIPRVASKHDAQQRQSSRPHQADQPEDRASQKVPSNSSLGLDFSSGDLPLLPPIQRVTSREEQQEPSSSAQPVRTSLPPPPPPPPPPQQHDDRRPDPPRLLQARPSSKAPATLSRASTSFAEFSSTFMRPTKSTSDPLQPSTAPSTSRRSQFLDSAMPHEHQRTSSPSSSISSLHKAVSSSNLAINSSPASSRSAHGSTNNATPRSSKSRLNMLNPVSMLMRRRNSQLPDAASEGPMAPHRMMDVPAMDLPRNYDPRIRGKGIHNFDDASRLPRNSSVTDVVDLAADSPSSANHRESRGAASGNAPRHSDGPRKPSPEKEHTPIFIENFDEERDDERAGTDPIQRESLANQDFLARMSRQLDFDSIDFSVPAARKHLSTEQSQVVVSQPQPQRGARSSKTTDSSSIRHSSDQSTVRSSMSNDTRATSPPQSPSHESARQSATLEPPFQPGQPLQHLSSTASRNSRFSFQLNSDHCIEQEKALEDKHKQKQASKASRHVSTADSRFEEMVDEEEDVDYDDMDDGGIHEEDIPGVNASDEDEPVGLGNQRLSMFAPANTVTRASSQSHYTNNDTAATSPDRTTGPFYQQKNADLYHNEVRSQDPDPSSSERTLTKSTIASDDMYFDDGIIDHPTQAGQNQYDEAISDSPTDSRFNQQAIDERLSSIQQLPDDTSTEDLRQENPEGAVDERRGVGEETADRDGQPEDSLVQGPSVDGAAALRHSSSLSAYHSALASAASRAAKNGKFNRQTSINTVSSNYSNDGEPTSGFVNKDWGDDDPQTFEDGDDEEDPMVAAANAEVLASEDADYYGQEFGFYGNPATSNGEAYSGGYFGHTNLLGASLVNRKNDPNLTPITERSEYSTRNSFIGSTPWGPPSVGGRDMSTMSPGLKDIAAGMGLDDEEMTLGQLLRLRKAAFEGGGSGSQSGHGRSGSQSAHGSSNSMDSSPTSASNPAAFPFRHSPMLSAGVGYGSAYGHERRPSELELADVREAPEDEENAETSESGFDSPISPTVSYGTATAVPLPVAHAQRKGSAEAYAKEYSELSSSPHSESTATFLPTSEIRSSSPLAINAPSVAGRGSPPVLSSPPLPQSPRGAAAPKQSPAAAPPPASAPVRSPQMSNTSSGPSPFTSPPIGTSSSPVSTPSTGIPTPPMTMMQKFANRPPPDAYRKSWEPSARMSPSLAGQPMSPGYGPGPVSSGGAGSAGAGATSVAYVREVGEDGLERWWLERRRKQSDGVLVVVGREAVQGGI